MTKKYISPKDYKNLSAYLDGELNAYSSRKMKNRLERDPNLRAALEAFRETKSILQRTPKRRAPRSFSLSPKMVAKSPPMPRLVPVLNYVTAIAMILFFFSILPPFGMGGAPAQEMMLASADMVAGDPAVAEAPAVAGEYAVEEAMPMAEVPEIAEVEAEMEGEQEPAPAEEPAESAEGSPAEEEIVEEETIPATESLAEEARGAEATPMAEFAENAEDAVAESPPSNEIETEKSTTGGQSVENPPAMAPPNAEESAEATSFTLWQEILLGAILIFATIGFILRRKATAKWEKLS